jgi:hypothetical protein
VSAFTSANAIAPIMFVPTEKLPVYVPAVPEGREVTIALASGMTAPIE